MSVALVHPTGAPVPQPHPPLSIYADDNSPKATIDFETFSCADIKKTGSWRYSRDPSTDPLCMAYRLPWWPRSRLWHPAFPEYGIEASEEPTELFEWIEAGGQVEAHNAMMEQSVWQNIMQPRFGWPAVTQEQWRCSAAKAASFAIPRSLDGAGYVMRLATQKDGEGHKLMMRLTRPRKPTRKDPRTRHGSREEYLRLFEYCVRDVDTEHELSGSLPDLPRAEQLVFNVDQRINKRGMLVDVAGIAAALDLVQQINRDLTRRMRLLTGGRLVVADDGTRLLEGGIEVLTAEQIDVLAVDTAGSGGAVVPTYVVRDLGVGVEPEVEGGIVKPTQRKKILEWVHGRGVPMEDTRGDTIDEWLKGPMLTAEKADVREVLQIVRALNRTSTAKFVAMVNMADPEDHRVRGVMLYCGADTGRWAGRGIQPHNFPRGTIKNMAQVWRDIMSCDREWVEFLYGDLMTLLSHATRGAVMAPEGRDLMVADYAAIEARVVFWLSGDERAMGIMAAGDCIYSDMGETIFGVPAREVYALSKSGANALYRFVGKQAILGLGYGMGRDKFRDTCLKFGTELDEDLCALVVTAYREKYWRVKQLWSRYEEGAILAVKSRRPVKTGMVTWACRGRFLHCRLPSGRLLAYPDPAVQKVRKWNRDVEQLTFMGQDSKTRQWVRMSTWGGTLVENVTQAVARDLLAAAMVRAERTRVYDVVLHVHDEIVCEVDKDKGDVREFEDLMSRLPDWARGCPVAAEGWRGPRYRK